MQTNVRVYVGLVVITAVAVTIALTFTLMPFDLRLAQGPAVFVLMGLLAQSIAHSARKTFTGSIAFLPFLTSIILYPSWVCVVLVAVAMVIGEFREKKPNIKRVFNVAQYVVAIGAAAAVYVALGGQSIQVDKSFNLV